MSHNQLLKGDPKSHEKFAWRMKLGSRVMQARICQGVELPVTLAVVTKADAAGVLTGCNLLNAMSRADLLASTRIPTKLCNM